MGVVGHQDFWVTGSRFFFQRDASGSSVFPELDLGVIGVANPAITPEKLELEDSDGGIKRTVDETLSKIDETYEITCSNLNPDNLALLFLSSAPETFTQSVAHKRVSHHVHPGRLAKIKDNDAAATALYGLGAVAGVLSAAPSGGVLSTAVLTAINAATKTLTITGDITAGLTNGESIVVEGTGLANVGNSRTYTVASFSFGGGNTSIVVVESPAANEAAITGVLIYKAAGDSGTVYANADWEVVSLDRGYIRIKTGGAIVAEADLVVAFSTAAISGERLLKPQTAQGEVKGTARIFWGRGNNAQQTVREARVSITPGSANFSADDYSNFVLTVKVLSDVTAPEPAGRILGFKGALPAKS